MVAFNQNLYRFFILVAALTTWEIYAGFVNPILLVGPSQVVSALSQVLTTDVVWREFTFYPNLVTTLFEILAAYAVSVAIGLPLGFAIGSLRRVGAAYEPLLLGFFLFPHVVLYPLIFLIFGIGVISKIVIGIIIGFFYVTFNTSAGIRQVDRGLISLAKSLGYSEFTVFLKVVMPAAAPTIVSGLRLGFAYSLIGIIVGELLLPNIGIGLLLDVTGSTFQTASHLAMILVTVGLGIVGDGLFRMAESRVLRWRFG